jgi:hypothetical protein
MDTYTDRQIEVANILRSSSGDQLSHEAIDEVISMVGDMEKRSVQVPDNQAEIDLRIKLLNETDWRKRAALSAMIISKSLD